MTSCRIGRSDMLASTSGRGAALPSRECLTHAESSARASHLAFRKRQSCCGPLKASSSSRARLQQRQQQQQPSLPKQRSTLNSNCEVPKAFCDSRVGPVTPAPDYTALDAQPLSRLVMALFRRKMVAAIGEDSTYQGHHRPDTHAQLSVPTPSPDPAGNPVHPDLPVSFVAVATVQALALSISCDDCPSLPRHLRAAGQGGVISGMMWQGLMFATPFPAFSAKLNAWATAFVCQWLMGPQAVNDTEVDGGKVGRGQGVLVERCRYLEESGCASVCVNSCKVPTQEFFATKMGIPLTMEPNYEDFSCQYSFGRTPPPQALDPAFVAPCFGQCPTSRTSAPPLVAGAPVPRCKSIVVDAA